MIPEGLEVLFVGRSRSGFCPDHLPRRTRIPTKTRGRVVEDTGRGILCEFDVAEERVRMYVPKSELKKIVRKER